MTMHLTALHVPHTTPARPPRRILITGSQGQLGRALQQELAADVLLSVDQPEFDVADPSATSLPTGIPGAGFTMRLAISSAMPQRSNSFAR